MVLSFSGCVDIRAILKPIVDQPGGTRTHGAVKVNYIQRYHSAKQGTYYRQKAAGYGAQNTYCGPLTKNNRFYLLKNPSAKYGINFSIQKKLYAATDGHSSPTKLISTETITVDVPPTAIGGSGEIASFNTLNSCTYVNSQPFGVRSKFDYKVIKAKYYNPAKTSNNKQLVKESQDQLASCFNQCATEGCFTLNVSNTSDIAEYQQAIASFDNLFTQDAIAIATIHHALKIEESSCQLSDFVLNGDTFSTSSENCSYVIDVTNKVKASGAFPENLNVRVVNNKKHIAYNLFPPIPINFYGESKVLAESFNEKFGGMISHFETSANGIYFGSENECLKVGY
jgi:hypothetical protein